MKHLSLLSILLVVSLFFISCSSSDDDDPITPPDETVKYSQVAVIINSNCLSCHSKPPVNNAPMPLTAASDVESAIRTRNLIGRIENGTMPPNGTLSAVQIQTIKDWQTGGFIN